METQTESREAENPKSLDVVARSLGFVESPEMENLRTAIIALKKENKDFTNELNLYEDLADAAIDAINPDLHARAQIGLMVMKASIYADMGDFARYDALRMDITEYCINRGFDDIDQTLNSLEKPEFDPVDTRDRINQL
jgi:hypothetical protein